MPEETLWDWLDRGASKQDYLEHQARDRSRRQAIKRLRAGGHWQTVLRVAAALPQPFTLNDVSVAAWRVCPEFFGMRGYPYPDNHKVHYILYGSRGLIAHGLIERVREGLFRVADAPAPQGPAATGGEVPGPSESENGEA